MKIKWLPPAFYIMLTLLVLGNLLQKGYIFSLDLYFSPHPDYTNYYWGIIEWATSVYGTGIASTPFWWIMELFYSFMPGWVLEKVILVGVLFLCGWGAHQLVGQNRTPGCYLAGIFYLLNPFVYSRLMAGQWAVLLAYAMIPLALSAFLRLLRDGGWKNASVTAVLATITGMMQVQGYVMLLLVFWIVFIARLLGEREQKSKLTCILRWIGAAVVIGIGLNMYWLLPFLTSPSTILTQFSLAEAEAFMPQPTNGVITSIAIATLHGFWREGMIHIMQIIPFWWLLFSMFLYFPLQAVIDSFFSWIRRLIDWFFIKEADTKTSDAPGEQSWLVPAFICIGILGYILALGMASNLTKPLFTWLWEHVSLFKSFRDSHKFVSLLALAYAFLGAVGLNTLVNIIKPTKNPHRRACTVALVILALLLPLTYAWPIYGLYGQVGVTDYPDEWYEVNEYLKQDMDDYNVLFLPWHMYMDYSFVPNKDKRVVNLSPQYFHQSVIAADNVEVGGIYSQSHDSISNFIEYLLANKEKYDNLGELLAPLNVKYLILVREADFTNYDFIYKQKDLQITLECDNIVLFKNERATGQNIYATGNVTYITNLDDYLELSKTQDVLEHIYIIQPDNCDSTDIKFNTINNDAKTTFDYTEISPVNYRIINTIDPYIIFTVGQYMNVSAWEYNGQSPAMYNLGIMPVFSSDLSNGELRYSRFYQIYLPGYLISGLTFLYLAVRCIISRHRRFQ